MMCKDVTKEIWGDSKGNWFQRQEPKIKLPTAEEWSRVVEEAQEKNKPLAKVYYEKLDDGTFKIVALEGFYSDAEIVAKYGKKVWKKYFDQEHSMVNYRSMANYRQGGHVSFRTSRGRLDSIGPGDLTVDYVYTKEQFSASIAEAKLCGSTLSRIIKEVKAATKVIEI